MWETWCFNAVTTFALQINVLDIFLSKLFSWCVFFFFRQLTLFVSVFPVRENTYTTSYFVIWYFVSFHFISLYLLLVVHLPFALSTVSYWLRCVLSRVFLVFSYFVSNSDFVRSRFVLGIFSFILSLLSFYKLHSYIATTQNTFIFYLYLHRFQVEAPTIFDTGTQWSDLGVRVWVWVCAVCYLAKSLTVIFCVYIVKMNGNFIFNVLGVDGVICITI